MWEARSSGQALAQRFLRNVNLWVKAFLGRRFGVEPCSVERSPKTLHITNLSQISWTLKPVVIQGRGGEGALQAQNKKTSQSQLLSGVCGHKATQCGGLARTRACLQPGCSPPPPLKQKKAFPARAAHKVGRPRTPTYPAVFSFSCPFTNQRGNTTSFQWPSDFFLAPWPCIWEMLHARECE